MSCSRKGEARHNHQATTLVVTTRVVQVTVMVAAVPPGTVGITSALRRGLRYHLTLLVGLLQGHRRLRYRHLPFQFR